MPEDKTNPKYSRKIFWLWIVFHEIPRFEKIYETAPAKLTWNLGWNGPAQSTWDFSLIFLSVFLFIKYKRYQ